MSDLTFARDEIARRVAEIIEIGKTDDERAHSMEDELRFEVIMKFCPSLIAHQIIELANADFGRFCA